MNYRILVLEKIIFLLLISLNSILYGKELNLNSSLANSGSHPIAKTRGGRTRIRINIAPIYYDYDPDYFEYREDDFECIPYYSYYGYPPSAFNFGLRVRRGRTYYYCPRRYYKRHKHRNSRPRHIGGEHSRHRH